MQWVINNAHHGERGARFVGLSQLLLLLLPALVHIYSALHFASSADISLEELLNVLNPTR